MAHPTAYELSKVPLFAGLSEQARNVIAGYLTPEEYGAGRIIVREGDTAFAFFVISRGKAAVTQDGREQRMLAAGDFFGEIAIVGDAGRRTATVTATEDVLVWTMFGANLRRLVSEHPDLAAELDKAVKQRLSS